MTCDEFRDAYDPRVSTRFAASALSGAIDHVDGCATCSDWYMGNEVTAAGGNPAAHPCIHVAYHSLHQCLEHVDPRDCPDTLLIHWHGRYALPVRDGGRTTVAIAFCPWCAVPLPRR
jgi:hypothetical protein